MPTRQHMIDWLKEGFDHHVERPELAKRCFEVFGISSLDDLTVRSAFSVKSAWKALRNLENDLEESEDGLFLIPLTFGKNCVLLHSVQQGLLGYL